jgi:hypothetical protein
MAKNGFKVMDSDLHVLEPKDLWQQYIDPAFAARVPKGIDRHHSDRQLDFNGHVAPDHPFDWGPIGLRLWTRLTRTRLRTIETRLHRSGQWIWRVQTSPSYIRARVYLL